MKTFAPNHILTDILKSFYQDKFARHCSSSACLGKEWNFYHGTTTCVDRVNNLMQPNEIVEAGIRLDPTKQNVNVGDFPIDNIDQDTIDSRREVWDNSNGDNPVDEPLPRRLLDHPEVKKINPDKERFPSIETLRQRLGEEGYNHCVREHCAIVMDMDDGGDEFMREMEDRMCIMASVFQSKETLILNGRHFDKRSHFANRGGRWKGIRDDQDEDGLPLRTVEERAAAYLDEAVNHLEHIQSDEYENRVDYTELDYCYAADSFIGAVVFMLRHSGQPRFVSFHHPNENEEFSKSALILVAANADLKRVGAHGLGVACNLSHIIRWRMPVPILASYHIEWGPASSPILGATFTTVEESYRPTLTEGIVKFKFV
jgi:hypothetical protein